MINVFLAGTGAAWGFGANTCVIHTFKIKQLSEGMPRLVEIVDTKEKLEAILDSSDERIPAGWVTLEKAQIRFYKAEK